jgi:hypothetical protein
MIHPETWKAIHDGVNGVWAVAGPLVGVFVGAYIANRNHRKHWLADNKREEYREVLAAMNKASGTVANANLSGSGALDTKALITGHPELITAVMEVLGTRIFTRKILEKINIEDRFVQACADLGADDDGRRFTTTIDELSKDLRDAALQDIGV